MKKTELYEMEVFTMAFVKTEVQGAVEIITIDRPKALNALNPEVLADLKAALRQSIRRLSAALF